MEGWKIGGGASSDEAREEVAILFGMVGGVMSDVKIPTEKERCGVGA